MPGAAILDIDGTLVDSNYQHVIAWSRAFRRAGVVVPAAQLHRRIGMGGDRLVAAAAGDQVEKRCGDAVRSAEEEIYEDLMDEVLPVDGARELIGGLRERFDAVVLASSARASEVDRYLDLLDARDLATDWTTSADVDTTKPDPDLVHSALEKVGADEGVMIGDTTWDVLAARQASVEAVGVLTGGIAAAELFDAGAMAVYKSARELVGKLDGLELLLGDQRG